VRITMKRPLNVWIASTLTALVVFGPGVQSAQSQPGNPAPGISKTHIRTVEFQSQRNACTRMWENVYHVQLLDEAGNPVGATREMRHRYIEKGNGINYNAAPPGQPVRWEKTDPTIRAAEDGIHTYKVETGPARISSLRKS